MSMFYNLRISAKLFVGFGFLLLLTVFLGVFSIVMLARVNQNAYELGTNWMPSVNAAMGIKERVSRIRSQEAQMVSAENPEEVDKYLARTKEAITGLRENEADYARLISDPEEKKQFDEYSKSMTAYLQITDKLAALAREGNGKDALALMRTDSSKINTRVRELVDRMVKINVDGGVNAYKSGIESYQTSRILIISVLVVSILLGMVLAYAIARIVSRPLQDALKVAQTVASGDLTSRIEVATKDETGLLLQALKEMNQSLLQVVTEVRQGTDEIAAASTEIANGNMDLSNRTENQASSLEETASSMEEITSTIQHNSDNARQANQLSHSASAVAQKGGDVVSQVVDTMGSINASSKKIVDIIAVIDGIAFQTNILALNAAVEAARAGEQGRGFAVVASEVRNLAQRSASAAKEIKELINDSVEKVGEGTRLVDQAGSTMKEVVESVKRVSDIISEITAAGAEQSSGIQQINEAVTQMDQMTQQNAALVEQAAAAAGALQDQAANLSRVVSVFKLEQSGDHARSALSRPLASKTPKASSTVRALPKPVTKPAARASAASRPSSPKSNAGRKEPVTAGSNDDWEEF
ncbi:MCP four helix bundle domain-containing protein [Undibacterium sp. CY18W]|uniref:MCP four helix bundle domain-containing protein n=1 Tax=Undibacterium hunanense TaxID=2762292 RepID=A0ABR6ZLK4_9BURK|nr:methyl-accepting chemotaxis protein [Undibacterium hunanense]MBC3916795.1 MCP four helix bundle domain-containing protein [Undibacterium hunanense]